MKYLSFFSVLLLQFFISNMYAQENSKLKILTQTSVGINAFELDPTIQPQEKELQRYIKINLESGIYFSESTIVGIGILYDKSEINSCSFVFDKVNLKRKKSRVGSLLFVQQNLRFQKRKSFNKGVYSFIKVAISSTKISEQLALNSSTVDELRNLEDKYIFYAHGTIGLMLNFNKKTALLIQWTIEPILIDGAAFLNGIEHTNSFRNFIEFGFRRDFYL